MPQFNAYPLITSPQPEDLLLTFQDSSGAVKTVTVDNMADAIGDILGTSQGAPVTAKYILQTPNANLSSAQSLSELTTGLLKSTTVTGVLSIAIAGSDYLAPGLITSSGLTTITGVLLGRNTAGTGAIEALATIPVAVQNNITRVGTIVAGIWNGTAIDLETKVAGDLQIANFDGGSGASSSTFWRGDGTWVEVSGSGTVTNTGNLTVNQVVVGNALSDVKILAAGTNGFVLTMVAGIPAWASAGAGSGIGGSTGSTDNALIRADGTGGATVQNSNVTLADSGTALVFSGAAGLTAGGSNQNIQFTPSGSGYIRIDITTGIAQIMRASSASGYASYRIYNDLDSGARALEMGYSGSSFASPIITGGIVGESAYITSTGAYPLQFGINNTAAFILNAIGDASFIGSLTPDQVLGIVGTTTNNNPSAGRVGETVSSLVASGTPVGLTTNTGVNVTSITLTVGDWDVSANLNLASSSATVTGASGGITSTSATVPTDGTEVYSGVQVTLLSETDSITLPSKRFLISGTTTVYLVANVVFSAGSVAAFGSIQARRRR